MFFVDGVATVQFLLSLDYLFEEILHAMFALKFSIVSESSRLTEGGLEGGK